MIANNLAGSTDFPDLTSCEREPIHLLGEIEPNGCMLIVSSHDLVVLQASSNTLSVFGAAPEALLGMNLKEVFSPDNAERIVTGISGDLNRRYVNGLRSVFGETEFGALIHRQNGLLIIELEPYPTAATRVAEPDVYAALTDALTEIDASLPLVDLCQRVATRIRHLTGFDRVMIYRFLKDDSGCVIAEQKREDLLPYLGLRYPASDIPAQARRFYLINTLRLKADVNAPTAVLVPPLNPVTGTTVDMTVCILRAMSAVHVEYLRNMNVAASMSISIVMDGRLWGLIACHHCDAKLVPHSTRITCDVLARVFSSHIAAAEQRDEQSYANALEELTENIEQQLRSGHDVAATLNETAENLLAVIGATGCIFTIRGKIVSFGITPNPAQVDALLDWLGVNQREHVLTSERLASINPAAEEFSDLICGLMSIRIALGGTDFVVCFRPPIVQVVTWAGNPDKPMHETEAGLRLSPRRSFEQWKQIFRDTSEPWSDRERKFASTLRPIIAEMLFLQLNEEIVRLNVELARSNVELESFSYTASHDLQEPVRTIRAYAQLLARTTSTDPKSESRVLIKTIEDSAARMGSLINSLLIYSHLGGSLRRENVPVNLEEVVRWVLTSLGEQIREAGAVITYDSLPFISSDLDYMEQLFQNFISNSLKYRQPDVPLRIHISSYSEHNSAFLSVHDNGQGFDQKYAEMIFAAFKRLHGREVPGHGVGLATCKRIVELHNGRIWAESAGLNSGATFWFTLPISAEIAARTSA